MEKLWRVPRTVERIGIITAGDAHKEKVKRLFNGLFNRDILSIVFIDSPIAKELINVNGKIKSIKKIEDMPSADWSIICDLFSVSKNLETVCVRASDTNYDQLLKIVKSCKDLVILKTDCFEFNDDIHKKMINILQEQRKNKLPISIILVGNQWRIEPLHPKKMKNLL